MTDIVERLRNIANPESVAGWSSLLTEAADEIERLRTITDDDVNAAWAIAEAWIERPFRVNIHDFVRSPTDPPPGPEREEAIAALHHAEAAAERENREVMRSILKAARRHAPIASAP